MKKNAQICPGTLFVESGVLQVYIQTEKLTLTVGEPIRENPRAVSNKLSIPFIGIGIWEFSTPAA